MTHLQKVTIANGATVSSIGDISGATFVGVILPAAFTGVALKFQVAAASDATFTPLYDTAGSEVSYTVAQGRAIALPQATLGPWQWLRLVSGAAEGAARDIVLVLKEQ